MLVAPTAIFEKNPCCQFPIHDTRSFKWNSPGVAFTTDFLTLSNSPGKCLQKKYVLGYFLFFLSFVDFNSWISSKCLARTILLKQVSILDWKLATCIFPNDSCWSNQRRLFSCWLLQQLSLKKNPCCQFPTQDTRLFKWNSPGHAFTTNF